MTAPTEGPRAVLDLILCRLITARDHRQTQAELAKSLRSLVSDEWGDTEWGACVRDAAARAVERGWATRAGRSSFKLTSAGGERALGFLGIESLPKATRWTRLVNAYLIPKALGLDLTAPSARNKIAQADGLRAAILNHAFGLALDDGASTSRAKTALAWQQLGVRSDRAFTVNAVLAATVLDGKARNLAVVAEQITALAAGSRSRSVDALRSEVLQRWLRGESPTAMIPPDAPTPAPAAHAATATSTTTATTATTASPTLEEFAALVVDAARASTTGRFGDRKVFVSHVWRALAPGLRGRGFDEASFKAALVDAHRQGLLVLRRADLVGAMNPDDVKRSEIRYRNATFHFVQLEPQPATAPQEATHAQ